MRPCLLSRLALAQLTGLAVCLTGSAFWMLHHRSAADDALQRWSAAQTALHHVESSPHHNSAHLVETLEAEAGRAQSSVRQLADALYGGAAMPGEAKTRLPRDRAEAYFELVEFTEGLTALAQVANVRLNAGEAFGFASYTHAGPEPQWIASVHRQKLAIEKVVHCLLQARPFALVAVQRERPEGEEPRREAKQGAAADFFRLDPALRTPPDIAPGAVMVRVTFEGETAHLREFLHTLAQHRPPLLVRAVEAEPAKTGPDGGLTSASLPSTLSRFAVTIHVADTPAAIAQLTAAAPPYQP